MRKVDKLIEILIAQAEAQMEVNKLLIQRIALLEARLNDK